MTTPLNTLLDTCERVANDIDEFLDDEWDGTDGFVALSAALRRDAEPLKATADAQLTFNDDDWRLIRAALRAEAQRKLQEVEKARFLVGRIPDKLAHLSQYAHRCERLALQIDVLLPRDAASVL